MRLTCPLCGERDRREFYYYGDAVWLDRPAADAAPEVWHDYIHLRDNPAGATQDLWYHDQGCGSWLRVRRDTVTHAVHEVALVDVATAPTPADPAPSSLPKYPTGGPGGVKPPGASDAFPSDGPAPAARPRATRNRKGDGDAA